MTTNTTTTVYDPVLTLPPKITAEIFLHCLPLDPLGTSRFKQPYVYSYFHKYDRREDTAPPPQLIISQVCRLWRDIAHGTPALWAAFKFSPREEAMSSGIANADAWLTRARDCPLTVMIYPPSNVHYMWGNPLFLDVFRRHAERMHAVDLELTMGNLEDMRAAAVDAPWSFPALRTLVMWPVDLDYEDFNGPPVQVLAPLLREVSMCQWHPEVHLTGLPWAQLTELTAEQYTIDDCLSILQLTPNLVECRLSLFPHTGHPITRRGESSASTITVVLRHLRALTLFKSFGNEADEASSADILDFLTLPALLTLEILDLDARADARFLEAFLARSAPPLETLALHKQGAAAIDLRTFALLPGLTRLELWRPTAAFAAALLDDVLAGGGARAMLPRLRTLAFWGCSRLARDGQWLREWFGQRDEWADTFGDENIQAVFLRFKTLGIEGLEVFVEDDRRV
ncbi:hypothetical protein DFH09DRAFT_1185504 [Mycena vulgaris]|nr:hypothetical protein DFH09DRAFT_1185504 [Mycena vulgaris]